MQILEQSVRDSVSRHANDKIRRVKLNKSIDSDAMVYKAEQREHEMNQLMSFEQELLKKNS